MTDPLFFSDPRLGAFLQGAAEVLQVDVASIGPATDFRVDIPDWDSLRGFAMLILLEDVYGLRVSEDVFIGCRTLGDLIALSEPDEGQSV